MITYQLTDTGILILSPSGPIAADDFTDLTAKVDHWIEQGNTLKGLMIEADKFPGWKDLAGLSAHFKFVRDHHRQIPRVAFVSDSGFLSALPRIGRHFVQANLRQFPADQIEAALDWVNSPPEPQALAIRHSWFSEHKLFWIQINGRITTAEYQDLLKTVEDRLKNQSPVSFLVDIDELDGSDVGAMFADRNFGLTHLRDIKRIALVGNQPWCEKLCAIPNPFKFEIRAFDEASEFEAWNWAVS